MAARNVDPMAVPFTFHELLSRQRIALGLTQREVAQRLAAHDIDVTSAAVGQWEKGSVPRSPLIVEALEKVLDCPGEFTTALGIVGSAAGEGRLAAIERRLGAVEAGLRDLLAELRARS